MIKSPSLRLASVVVFFGVFLALPHAVHAQSVSAVFSGPQNMDQGLQNGLNNITGYVAFLLVETKVLETKWFEAPKGCIQSELLSLGSIFLQS
jgi:hypothetical protein